jgi:ATP-dependent DNA helicase RecG
LLNRKGGHLLLGVNNRGEVEGVFDDCVQNIINQIVTCANNPQKLNPIVYLSPETIDYNGKKVIHILIPESSQVHATNGKIFDRNEDGDFNITGQSAQVTRLYLRKQNIYTENRLYPYVRLTDFKPQLFGRIRILAKNQRPNHPWFEMTNEELLRSAGLVRYDYNTDRQGYTLAAVLLLGKDEVIRDILSYHKTDAIVRIENVDRYDDRDEIRTNLIDSYDRLMEFVKKHLPDKFHQEGDMRISLRDHIFREVISNLLIHREYTSAFPAKFIIEADRVITENWNRPHDGGIINPANFSPYPKNPVIANFFKEIGWVDELGSGVRNTYKYCGKYTQGTSPQFVDEEIFKTIIPLKPEITGELRENYGRNTEKRFGKTPNKY